MILKPALAAVAAFFILALPASAAGYLKLGDIKGESTDARHKDWIDIASVSEGIDQTAGTATGSARAVGKATIRPIIVTKAVDGASPALREAAATGKVFKDATVEYGRLTLVLKDVRVVSAGSASDGSGLVEEITLSAASAEWQVPGTPGVKSVTFNAVTGKP